jgi:hypothetical protein
MKDISPKACGGTEENGEIRATLFENSTVIYCKVTIIGK